VVFSALLPNLGFDIGTYHVDSFWIGSVLVLVLTGLYTMLGGMRAVVYTEALQTVVLVIGSVLITYFGMKEVGGWQELRNIVHTEGDPAGYVERFNLWKPLLPKNVESTWEPVIVKDAAGNVTKQAWYFNLKGHYPWIGMLICAPVIGLWYWCTCQYIVQRALGAKDETQARRGSIFAGFLKLLPVFVFIIPGVICYALAKSGKVAAFAGMIDSSGNPIQAQFQAAFPQMVIHVLPVGVRGIVVAGLLAALMSSLAGVFNASSTLFTMDIYQKYKPNASQHQLVWMGRMATFVCVLIGIAWIPVIKNSRGLYDYLQGVQGYLAPPIFVVFFLGVFWKRLNAQGCLAGLLGGFLLGVFRLVVDTPVTLGLRGSYEEGSFLWIVNNIYFQYFSIIITLVSMVAMVVVSYMTAPPSAAQISGLTFATTTDAQKQESRESWSSLDVVATVALLAAIVAAYSYFRG
jgi:SSS family solute:Na+ symporter